MRVRRNYLSSAINWLLVPELLSLVEKGIPESEKKVHQTDVLLAIPSFRVSTFSQSIDVDSSSDFLEFIRRSSEPARHVDVMLECHRAPKQIDHYSIKPAYLHFSWSEEGSWVEISRTDTTSALTLLAEFEGRLQLSPARPTRTEEEKSRRMSRTVFLAHAFDDIGRSYAHQITRFLNLLGFQVVSGEGFSPERVSSKVRRRLTEQELVIAIVSRDEDVTWITQEIATANAVDKPLFLLILEGLALKPGILGDLEYVRFLDKQLSGAFAAVLEGLQELGFTFK